MKITKSELKEMIREALREELKAKKPLKEARSAADIKAEIARLQRELANAKAAEKKATYGGKRPELVYIWDIYLDERHKGDWTSAEDYGTLDEPEWDGYVYETKEAAIEGGWDHLNELADEGELEYDVDDYTVDWMALPLAEMSEDILRFSNLAHLI